MNYFTRIEAEPGTDVSAERELFAQGHVYVAKDRRLQFIIFGQKLQAVQSTICDLTGEDVKISSLYECARRKLKSGRHMSWSVERVSVDQLVEVPTHKFERVVVCAVQRSAWKLQSLHSETDCRNGGETD